MIGAFSFNNVESSYFNLVCKSIKRPLLPAVKTKRLEIPGISGVYDFESSEYSMRSVTMKIAYIGTDYSELRTRARSIAAWLSNSSWCKLIINDEPDKYYLAKVTSEIDLESLWMSGSADISFDCQPFAYYISEMIHTFTVTGARTYSFTNPGNKVVNYKSPEGSKSMIGMIGTFTSLTLSMNGKTLNYIDPLTTMLVIDNIEMAATVGSINHFNSLTGDIETFIPINPGSNTLSISGSNLNFEMSIVYIPLWI